mmetsp:Transcript_22551/g.63172  ORF Transcript_22551/g.63172 Transcript_22551/m.63172 type:complete len:229 (+) Transcript_22551:482-1168(+)
MTCSSTSQRSFPPGCSTTAARSVARGFPPHAWTRSATSTRSLARSGRASKRSRSRSTRGGRSTAGPSSPSTSSALQATRGGCCSSPAPGPSAMAATSRKTWFAKSSPARSTRHHMPTFASGSCCICVAIRRMIWIARRATQRRGTKALYLGSTSSRSSVWKHGLFRSMTVWSHWRSCSPFLLRAFSIWRIIACTTSHFSSAFARSVPSASAPGADAITQACARRTGGA